MSNNGSLSSIPASEERILRAAARPIRDRGLSGTSIRAIAEAAGVLPGSLTYRFPTKEELVVTLGERAIDHALGEVQRAIEKSDDPI